MRVKANGGAFLSSEVKILLEEKQLKKLQSVIYDSLIDEIKRARQDVGLEKRYFNKRELTQYLHISNNTLDKWIINGLPKVNIAGSVRYDRFAVDRWLSENSNGY